MEPIDYSTLTQLPNYRNRPIPKYKWLQTNMTERARRKFDLFFHGARLLYSIPVKDSEIQVIEVNVKVIVRNQNTFSDLVHRVIPYTVLLIETYDNKWFKISVAATHNNQTSKYMEDVDMRSSSVWMSFQEFKSFIPSILEGLENYRSKKDFWRSMSQILAEQNERVQAYKKYEKVCYDDNDIIEMYEIEAQRTTAHRTCTECAGAVKKRLSLVIDLYQIECPEDNEWSRFVEELEDIKESLLHDIETAFAKGDFVWYVKMEEMAPQDPMKELKEILLSYVDIMQETLFAIRRACECEPNRVGKGMDKANELFQRLIDDILGL